MAGGGGGYPSIAYVGGGIVFTLFLIVMFSMYALSNASVSCPISAEAITTNFNTGGIAGIIVGTGQLAVLAFTPCTGLPWWVFAFAFLPFGITLAIYLTPFIGGG
jgi:hypothetical protein